MKRVECKNQFGKLGLWSCFLLLGLITPPHYSEAATLKPAPDQDSGVWLLLKKKKDVPFISTSGSLTSSNPKLRRVIKKHKIYEVSYPISNSKNPTLRKVIELRCKQCDANSLKKDLEKLGFGSKRRPIEIAPVYQTLLTPNDFSISFQNDYALNLIQAQCAWGITTGSPSVTLGISDVNFFADPNNGGLHEELAGGKVVYYDPNNSGARNHGTAVAITAAGNTNNNSGKSSIGFNSRLALYKANYNDVLAAANAGIRVINMSWATGCTPSSYIQQIITEAYNAGAFLVASAGNGGTLCGGAQNLVYPASYNHVFSVTSIGPNNNHERTIGNPGSTHHHNPAVDLSAPGYDIALSGSPGSYVTSSGTSFAAPFVTGTVGLMLSVNPNLTNSEIEQILLSTATNIDNVNPGYIGLIGTGRLNSCAAVNASVATSPMSATLTLKPPINCPSEDLGSAVVHVTGGTAPYTYSWSNGETAPDGISAPPGDYSVTVTDANGNTATASITIPTQVLTVSGVVSNVTSYQSSDGSIDITVTGPAPQSFLWTKAFSNFVANTEDLTGVSSGAYTVKIIGQHGCFIEKNFSVK